MSILVTTLVWGNFPGRESGLLAMLALADWANEEGLCWPSIASIARKIRLSETQTRRIVHKLVKTGFLVIEENSRGGRSSNLYRIQIEKLRALAKDRAVTDASPALSPAPGLPSHSHESRTVNNTSVNRKSTHAQSRSAAKTTLPEDFGISERVRAWASEQGYDQLDTHLQAFKQKARTQGYRYADWDQALMDAIQQDWAGLRKQASQNRDATPKRLRFDN